MVQCAAERAVLTSSKKSVTLKRVNKMAELQPLKGIRYNRALVSNLAEVVTPPFDVISPQAQERYYARHPYNVIRLELTKPEGKEDALNNRYTQAAATYGEWRLNGVLRQEE